MEINDENVHNAARLLKAYIWKNYCRECIDDNEIKEEGSAKYEECKGNGCFVYMTKALLDDMIQNTRKV